MGRLIARATREYCDARSVRFEILTLARPEEHLLGQGFHVRRTSQLGMAARIGLLSLLPDRTRLIFDHAGPAEVQGVLPAVARCPYAVYLHGIELWSPMPRRRRIALESAAIRVANSRYTVARARTVTPSLPDAEIVPPAVDAAVSGTPDPAILRRAGSGYVLTVGRMLSDERYKGHELLFAAIASLRNEGVPARLVVAGKGDDQPRLARAAAAAGLSDAVTFTGFVDEVTLACLYARAAAFAMPSTNEGFGITYVEAMRAGTPAIALAESAAAEILEEGRTGFLVPANHSALAARIGRLLRDPELRGRLGACAAEVWRTRYSTSRFSQSWASILSRLLESNGVREPAR